LKTTARIAVSVAALAAGATIAFAPHSLAQDAAPAGPAAGAPDMVTVNDPAGPPPDPKNIPFVLPKDIKWTGTPGRQETANLYGNPNQPGPYAILIKWYPGNFSRPHFHDKIRHIAVISGTWWVSSSSTYDEKTTYPLHAGATATDQENGIHWDGSRSGDPEPAIIYLYGEGPVSTVFVDTAGKPIPLAAKK